MSAVMATDREYGRGDCRVYSDEGYEYERREFSPRRHRDGVGGEYERMRVAERKYLPGRVGVDEDGGYWDEPMEGFQRSYGRVGEFGNADGRCMCEPASALKGDSSRVRDIVDEKHLPCHEDGKFQRPRTMGSGPEVERCVCDGRYVREPVSVFRSDLDRLCDIVDGKRLCDLENAEFKRPRTMGPGPVPEVEKEVERCVGDGCCMREPVSRLRRDYGIREDGEFKRPRKMVLGPEEEVERCVGDAKYLHHPSKEILRKDHCRHSENLEGKYSLASESEVVEGKYSLGGEACTSERPRGRCLGEEKRYLGVGVGTRAGVSDGGYLHEPPQERFCRGCGKHSDTVDRWEEFDGRVMCRRHGYGHVDDNSRDEKCSLRCYRFNEAVSRVDSSALKSQGNHLMHEHGKYDDAMVTGGGGRAGVRSERHYLSQQYEDDSLRLEAEKEKLMVSTQPKGHAIHHSGDYGLPSPYPYASLHEAEGHHLPQGQPFRREVFGKDNPLYYSKDESFEQSSTCPKAFPSGSSIGFREEFTMSRQGLQAHYDGVGLSSTMMNNPLGYDEYGKELPVRSPVDPDGLSSDVRSYRWAYVEKMRHYTYPDSGRRDGDYIVAGSQDKHGGIIGDGKEKGHLDVQRTRGMIPIVDEMDQLSHRDHFRDGRPWENDPYSQGQSNSKYGHAAGSPPRVRKHDRVVFGYGDAPLDSEIEVYKDFESYQLEERRGYEIEYDVLCHRERPDMRSGEYYDSPSGRLSPDNRSLPEHNSGLLTLTSGRSAHKIFGEMSADELDNYDDLHPVIVSKKSKFSSPKHGITGRRIGRVSSQLTSQELPHPTSSGLSKSQKSTRNIKARLGPRLQDVDISENRSSVKSRLGPRVPNPHVSHPKNKKYRASMKSRLGPVH